MVLAAWAGSHTTCSSFELPCLGVDGAISWYIVHRKSSPS